MKFCVLALDYDGTIARDGNPDPDVRAAIAEARARGIFVLIVTGRIIGDLRRVAGPLDFVDAVVGENGAVIEFSSGISRLLGAPPPEVFTAELRRQRIVFSVGRSVVEMDEVEAPRVLDIIQKQELPLVLLFNRGRLMVLPQAVSKGTGLREALSLLRISPHNAIGIGDGENDHDLLASCEYGVAVGWGSKVLQASADETLPGTGPSDLAPYIHKMARKMRLPPERADRAPLTLGQTEDGCPLTLAVRGRNVLIAGAPRSGKSWASGLLCEQMILQGYTLCVIDAEGDYRTLESLPGVVIFGGDNPPPELPDLSRVLRHPHMSTVVDLSHVPYQEKVAYLHTLLPMLASLRRATGLPHRIVVDEAHYFLHEPNVRELLDFELGAYTLVTYHLSDLHPELRRVMDTVLVKRTTDPREVHTLWTMAGANYAESEWRAILGGLGIDEAALLPATKDSGDPLRRFTLGNRITAHVRHKAKYVDLQLIDAQGFAFTSNGVVIGAPARTLQDFVLALKTMPLSILDGHARRGDFSRWIADVFHDHVLASDIRKVEQRYRLGHTRDLYNALAELIQERYDISPRDADVHRIPLAPAAG